MGGFTEFVATVLGALNASDLPYLVTGSFASIFYSEPRTTMDIDLVVRAPLDQLEAFRMQMLARGLYAPSVDAGTDMFNIVDTASGWKADIIVWPDEPFERERFERRVRVELLPGVRAWIPTVEDMILAKLVWTRGRDSALQLRDVESMIEINREVLDRVYLRRWATELDVRDRLDELLDELG